MKIFSFYSWSWDKIKKTSVASGFQGLPLLMSLAACDQVEFPHVKLKKFDSGHCYLYIVLLVIFLVNPIWFSVTGFPFLLCFSLIPIGQKPPVSCSSFPRLPERLPTEHGPFVVLGELTWQFQKEISEQQCLNQRNKCLIMGILDVPWKQWKSCLLSLNFNNQYWSSLGTV